MTPYIVKDEDSKKRRRYVWKSAFTGDIVVTFIFRQTEHFVSYPWRARLGLRSLTSSCTCNKSNPVVNLYIHHANAEAWKLRKDRASGFYEFFALNACSTMHFVPWSWKIARRNDRWRSAYRSFGKVHFLQRFFFTQAKFSPNWGELRRLNSFLHWSIIYCILICCWQSEKHTTCWETWYLCFYPHRFVEMLYCNQHIRRSISFAKELSSTKATLSSALSFKIMGTILWVSIGHSLQRKISGFSKLLRLNESIEKLLVLMSLGVSDVLFLF